MEKIKQKSHDTSAGRNEHIVMLRKDAQEKLAKAENAWFVYAAECDLSDERERAFNVAENVRTAQRV